MTDVLPPELWSVLHASTDTELRARLAEARATGNRPLERAVVDVLRARLRARDDGLPSGPKAAA